MAKRSKKEEEKSESDITSSEKFFDKPREAIFASKFREDLTFWIETDRKTALRAMKLIEDIMRDPFRGIGKPEPLKYLGPNIWSRRLNQEDRIVYTVSQTRIVFLQAQNHYE